MRKLFKNRLVIITGVGRSGTTILGKVIGSMQPCFYLFEPALLKYLSSFPYSEVFTKILFEDYFLPLIHGRGNLNVNEWSYMGNYEPVQKINDRQKRLQRRSDAIYYVKLNNPLWVIKSNEFQHLMSFARVHFHNPRYIHIIRNGYDVVRSAVSRGWYTDDYCNNDIVENTYGGFAVRVPHFVSDHKDREKWAFWNAATRAACAWRHLTVQGMKYKKKCPESVIQFRYEDFCRQPLKFSSYLSTKLNLAQTELTMHHIKTVHSPDLKPFNHNIDEPEQTKFYELNKRLGYYH